MRLEDFPLPPNGSKRGIHWNASCYPEFNGYQYFVDECKAMHIGYIKFVDDGSGSGANVYRYVLDQGMIPIVRFFLAAPGRWTPREQDAVRRLVGMGVRLFELCNEPDLHVEWPDKDRPSDWLQRSVDAFCIYAPGVIELGGLPSTFSLASGAFGKLRIDLEGNHIEPIKVNFLNMIAARGFDWIFDEGAWLSIHNYTINHPIGYPNDAVHQEGQPLTEAEYNAAPPWAWDHRSMEDINGERERNKKPGITIWEDDTCFGAYKIFLAFLKDMGHHNTPIITTEGGPVMTDGQDGRYPKIHPALHMQMTEEIYREISTIPQYLAHCPWLIGQASTGHGGGWETCCWYTSIHNQMLESLGYAQRNHIPTVDLLKLAPLGTWGEPMPEPVDPEPQDPEPIEPPEPPDLLWEIPAWNDATVLETNAKGWIWQLVEARLEHNPGDHTLYIDAVDENGQRADDAVIFVQNADGTVLELLQDKPPTEPGRNLPIYKHDLLRVWIDDITTSNHVKGIHTRYEDHPEYETTWGHISYYLKFQNVLLEPQPEPEPEPPEEIVDDECIREAAWNHLYPQGGIDYNPDAAFQAVARDRGYGASVTNEFDIGPFRIQGFMLKIIFSIIGEWQDIQELNW